MYLHYIYTYRLWENHMSTTIQYIRITGGVNEETMPTTWGADWYNLQCSWLLHYTLDSTRHNEIMLITWGGDCNIKLLLVKQVGKRLNILWKVFWICQVRFLSNFLLFFVLVVCWLYYPILKWYILVLYPTVLWTFCKLYNSHFPIYFWIMFYQPVIS